MEYLFQWRRRPVWEHNRIAQAMRSGAMRAWHEAGVRSGFGRNSPAAVESRSAEGISLKFWNYLWPQRPCRCHKSLAKGCQIIVESRSFLSFGTRTWL